MSDRRVIPRDVREYLTPEGRNPFNEWVSRLKDEQTRMAIRTRLIRVRQGNLGDVAPVGEGVSELRIHFKTGYRIYFAEDKEEGAIVLLLCGGDKRTQRSDIEQAKSYWREYRSPGHAQALQEV